MNVKNSDQNAITNTFMAGAWLPALRVTALVDMIHFAAQLAQAVMGQVST